MWLSFMAYLWFPDRSNERYDPPVSTRRMPRATLTRRTRAMDSIVIVLRATGKYPRSMAAWTVKYRARPIGVQNNRKSNKRVTITVSHQERELQFRTKQQWHQAVEHTFAHLARECPRMTSWPRRIVEQGLYMIGNIILSELGKRNMGSAQTNTSAGASQTCSDVCQVCSLGCQMVTRNIALVFQHKRQLER